ncbi:thiol-disulfide oxidoreductase DCC family protein [Woodsholea maritima]|uniref:thiol-disulfide oxidoreductase DCC family protein n=1 Tax=Woodsholea maritima TaxID=240237 RepID=UPI000374AF48|nr:DCC1-like thiol-disulfide oxidoreductase family protein [Woodsholea maritima]
MQSLRHRLINLDGLDLSSIEGGRCLAVMDGACAVCSWGARTLSQHDGDDCIRIATIQSPLGIALLERAGLSAEDPQTWMVLHQGHVYTHASAMIFLGQRLAGGWAILARCAQLFPLRVLDYVYGVLARNRVRWFGRADMCALPDARLKARLVT